MEIARRLEVARCWGGEVRMNSGAQKIVGVRLLCMIL